MGTHPSQLENAPARFVVTGAHGVVGRQLMQRLASEGRPVLGIVRAEGASSGPTPVVARDLAAVSSIADVLRPGDILVHLAARAHVLHDRVDDRAAAYRAANVAPVRMVCASAREAGVRRMIFLSTAKVYGEGRADPYTLDDPLRPADAYAQSKQEAEEVLRSLASDGPEWTILRPPFVYAASGKGNFPRLVQLAGLAASVPLPLESVRNARSVIFVGNLVDAILRCAEHPAARNRTFLPTDRRDVSTPDLIRAIAYARGRRARLFPMPPSLLRAAASLVRRRPEMDRLTESLRLDGSAIRRDLEWEAPFSLDEGIRLSLGLPVGPRGAPTV